MFRVMYACNPVFNNSSNRYGSSCIIVQIFGCEEYCMGKTGVAIFLYATVIARFMGPTWGPSRADRILVGPVLAP